MANNRNALVTYHPLLCLSYYLVVLITTMFTTNPIVRLLSLTGAIFACLLSLNRQQMRQNIRLALIMISVSCLSNFIFVHSGATVLFEWQFTLFDKLHRYAFTAESLIYGGSFGVMMAAILLWFQSLSMVLTSDKIVFLFGRWLPKIALVLSMVMRFIPLFQRQALRIQESQRGLGLANGKQLGQRLKNGSLTFNSLFSWALENAVETSDSMNARGFGLGQRTNFTIYRFRQRDLFLGVFLSFLFVAVVLTFKEEAFKFYYYPRLRMIDSTAFVQASYLIVTILMAVPLLVEAKERIKWHYLKLKI